MPATLINSSGMGGFSMAGDVLMGTFHTTAKAWPTAERHVASFGVVRTGAVPADLEDEGLPAGLTIEPEAVIDFDVSTRERVTPSQAY